MMMLASRSRHLQAKAGELGRRGSTPSEILVLRWPTRQPSVVLPGWLNPSLSIARRRGAFQQTSETRGHVSWLLANYARLVADRSDYCHMAKLVLSLFATPVQGQARGRRVRPRHMPFAPELPQGLSALIWCHIEVPIRRSRRDLIYELWPFWPEANSWRCRKAQPDRARDREALGEAAVKRPARRSRLRVAPLGAASSMSTRQSGS